MKQNLFFRKEMKILSSGIMKNVFSFSAVLLLLFASCSKEDESLNTDIKDNQAPMGRLKGTGSDHGYFWTLYREGGSASITFPSAGTYAGNFAISYSSVTDVVGGKGWSTGSSSRTIGYNIGALSGSYNFVGVYGWTTSPLIEYYIAEKGSVAGGTNCGTVSSNGHTYTIYKQQRVNAPSIIGTATFWQYKSSWGGASTGKNGTVSMSNHWSAWKSKCGSLGSPNYQVFAIEAWGGKSGYINATVW